MARAAADSANRDTAEPLRQLGDLLESYLDAGAVDEIRRAFEFGARAHEGQHRLTGEPYIHHPLEVARILAGMHMDHATIAAAILHDTIEDTAVTKQQVIEAFGEEVADLVDGVTKLDKMQFRSRVEAQAESFRKMMLAMSRDLRVILIKLADRMHNMRTLSVMRPDKRRRIALETLEIYAPIAQRLGMNAFKAELQDLGFQAYYPFRHRVLKERLRKLRGNRREIVAKIRRTLEARLKEEGIPCRVVGRIKSPYSIFRKMRAKELSFDKVMDVYGFRIIVNGVSTCYQTLGAVHNLYKPVTGRFRDYIAIPKTNGYQSLHTVLFGPYGSPIEIQIRTRDMDQVAEKGIAAHWIYKSDADKPTSAQMRAREWLLSLLEMQKQAGNSVEFLEHVKVDLFPDEVYVFTPRGEIIQLPRESTVVDFAYAIHTDVGNHCVGARINRDLVPLRTRLKSGMTVEVLTDNGARSSPSWLDFVVTSKARAAIRHHLKNLQQEEAVELGHRMLDRALDALGTSLDAVPDAALQAFLAECRFERLEDLLADIAFGNRMPLLVAQKLLPHTSDGLGYAVPARDALKIKGTEGMVVNYANCCHPIPGDSITGYLSAGKGIVVHVAECPNARELRKHRERIIDLDWDAEISGEFRVALRVEVANKPGVLATIAATIAESGSNIEHVEYQERDGATAALRFTLTVRDRAHLARIIRRTRRNDVTLKVQRITG